MPIPIAHDQIAGMKPTAEQAAIIAAAQQVQAQTGQRVLVVGAGAGTGKTATQKMLEQVLRGRGQYTAFNKSLVEDSRPKFKKAAVNTGHSLAFRAVGKKYAHRLDGPRMKSERVAEMLGIESMTVVYTDKNGDEKRRVLDPGMLAGRVMVMVRRFCQSDDKEITEKHFGYIDGIDTAYIGDDGSTHRGRQNNDRVKEYLLPFCHKAWTDLQNPEGVLPFNADVYVKVWELNKPYIAADYILLDEAQDTASVMLSILRQQKHAMLVFVGDSNQSIYEWRGAVDAMKAFPDAPKQMLTQSFRFGQAIADVANSILATLKEPTDLVMTGLKSLRSRVVESKSWDDEEGLPTTFDGDCVLCRTNAKAVGTVLQAIADGKRPHLIGGGADVVDFVKAAKELKADRPTRHPELCCFQNWGEVVEYAKTDEGEDLQLMVRLIEAFGVDKILSALENMPEEKDADLVVSTAHKSKGREWDSVKLANDFPTANKMSDADRRLLYVAATRAKLVLDISECPPFTVRRDPQTGETIDVIEVAYTNGNPVDEPLQEPEKTTDELDIISQLEIAYGNQDTEVFVTLCNQLRSKLNMTMPVEEKKEVVAEDFGSFSVDTEVKVEVEQPKPVAREEPIVNGFGWYKWDGKWTACGPQNMEGRLVKVSRKNGEVQTERLGKVVRKFNDNWCYEVV